MPSPEFIELKLENQTNLVTGLVSTVGAALKNLSVNGTDLITPTSGHDLNPYADGIIMAPWANRIDRGRWKLKNEELQLKITDHAFDNALHGLVSQTIFKIETQKSSAVYLKTKLLPTTGYPFELEISINYQLTINGIEVTQTAVNLSKEIAPLVLGAHPYFQISGTPTEELEIKSSARSVDLVNERKIPVGKQAISGSEFDITDWRKLSDCHFDHGFSDLQRDASGYGHHYLRAPNQSLLDIWQSQEMKYAFIFTPDNYTNNADQTPRKAIAIEPQTGPANAFNSKADLIWLEPGHIFNASWGANFTPAN